MAYASYAPTSVTVYTEIGKAQPTAPISELDETRLKYRNLSITSQGTSATGTNNGQLVTSDVPITNAPTLSVTPTLSGNISRDAKVKIIESTGVATYSTSAVDTIKISSTDQLLNYVAKPADTEVALNEAQKGDTTIEEKVTKAEAKSEKEQEKQQAKAEMKAAKAEAKSEKEQEKQQAKAEKKAAKAEEKAAKAARKAAEAEEKAAKAARKAAKAKAEAAKVAKAKEEADKKAKAEAELAAAIKEAPDTAQVVKKPDQKQSVALSLTTRLGLSKGESAVLDEVIEATQSDERSRLALVHALTSSKAAKKALAQLKSKPDVARIGSMQSMNVANSAVSNRQAVTVAGSGKYDLPERTAKSLSRSGVSSGDSARDRGIWAETLYTWANQDQRDGISGYDSTIAGMAVGADAMVTNDLRLGVSLSYSKADVDGDDAASSVSDTDTWTATFYGTKLLDDAYINGQLSYGRSTTDTQRSLTFAGTTATGSYDTNIWNATLGVGMPMMVRDFSMTPNFGVQLTLISSDDYTETGAGAFNLTVMPEDHAQYIAKVGVDFADDISVSGGSLVPELRLKASYDFNEDAVEVSQRFTTTGSTTSKVQGPSPAQLAGNLGLGLSYTNLDGRFTVGINYDGQWKEDYNAHTATANFRFNF